MPGMHGLNGLIYTAQRSRLFPVHCLCRRDKQVSVAGITYGAVGFYNQIVPKGGNAKAHRTDYGRQCLPLLSDIYSLQTASLTERTRGTSVIPELLFALTRKQLLGPGAYGQVESNKRLPTIWKLPKPREGACLGDFAQAELWHNRVQANTIGPAMWTSAPYLRRLR